MKDYFKWLFEDAIPKMMIFLGNTLVYIIKLIFAFAIGWMIGAVLFGGNHDQEN
jgi:hypothetical protein